MPSSSRDNPPRLTTFARPRATPKRPRVTRPLTRRAAPNRDAVDTASTEPDAAIDLDLFLRRRRHPVLGVCRIDEHEPGDVVAVPRRKNPHHQSAERVPDEQERRRDAGALEQHGQLVGHAVPPFSASARRRSSQSRRGRSCRRASACAMPGWMSDQLIDEPPERRVHDHRRRTRTRAVEVQPESADVDQPSRHCRLSRSRSARTADSQRECLSGRRFLATRSREELPLGRAPSRLIRRSVEPNPESLRRNLHALLRRRRPREGLERRCGASRPRASSSSILNSTRFSRKAITACLSADERDRIRVPAPLVPRSPYRCSTPRAR